MPSQTTEAHWEQEFERWLAPFLAALGHKARRRWAPVWSCPGFVELVRAGRSPASLAEAFEASEQTIRNWVRQADLDEGTRTDGLTTTEHEEPTRLCR